MLGAGIAWWFARDTPADVERKQARAAAAHEANARDARPALYRWRDANGTLHITSKPPKGPDAGRAYERMDVEPRAGIEVRGDRA